MTPVECNNCGRPSSDGASLCTTCSKALADALRDVPALVDDLLVTFAKQDRLGGSAGGRRGKQVAPPLPVRLDIPPALYALGNTLTTTARDLADSIGVRLDTSHLTRPILGSAADPWRPGAAHNAIRVSRTARCAHTDLPPAMCAHCTGARLPLGVAPDEALTTLRPQPSPPVLGWHPPTALDSLRFAALWLADHVGVLRLQVEAHLVHDEIREALDTANTACSAPPTRLFVGRCDDCEADLWGWPDHRPAECARCGRIYTDMRSRWDSALLKLRGYPATAAVIAGHIGELYGVTVNRKAINLWHHRKRLTAVDTDDEGNPRFRIGEVLDLARRSQPKAG